LPLELYTAINIPIKSQKYLIPEIARIYFQQRAVASIKVSSFSIQPHQDIPTVKFQKRSSTMADNSIVKLDKVHSINLPKLNPKAYRFWRKQAEATLNIYSCLGIVSGTESRPVPPDGNNVTPAIRRATQNWDTRHSLAMQALLNCLDTQNITTIYTLESAPEMWTKLEQEYGTKSIEEHTRA
jgi:hypothetical protein